MPQLSTIHVVPKDGLTVIDPLTGRRLPPEGKTVSPSLYWRRRAANGEVTVSPPNPAPPAAPAPQPTRRRKSKED